MGHLTFTSPRYLYAYLAEEEDAYEDKKKLLKNNTLSQNSNYFFIYIVANYQASATHTQIGEKTT